MPRSHYAVSVIVPVYNAEKTVERCLSSILKQTFTDIEVLAVDDGSTDSSLAILRRIAGQDGRVRVFTQANSGVSAARNLAINHAAGEYVQFADSDDELPPTSTQQMVAAMRDTDCDLVIAPFIEVVGGMRNKRALLKQAQTLDQAAFLDKLSTHPNSFYFSVLWNKLYRRDIILRNSVRCDGHLPWGEDFAFNTEYYCWISRVSVLTEPVYHYIRNPAGLVVSTSRQCVLHPWYSAKVKVWLYRYYKRLFQSVGLYERYRKRLRWYLVTFTLNN